jgi:hypothetical protein
MPARDRKSINLGGGLHLNLNKKSVPVTAGTGGRLVRLATATDSPTWISSAAGSECRTGRIRCVAQYPG